MFAEFTIHSTKYFAVSLHLLQEQKITTKDITLCARQII